MGSGGGSTQVQTVQPSLKTNNAVEQPLGGAAVRMTNSMGAYAPFGTGGRLVSGVPFGQVAMAGPNPTVFGDPFNSQYAQGFFGHGGYANQPGQAPTQQLQQQAFQQQNPMQSWMMSFGAQPQAQQFQSPFQGATPQTMGMMGMLPFYNPSASNYVPQAPFSSFPQFQPHQQPTQAQPQGQSPPVVADMNTPNPGFAVTNLPPSGYPNGVPSGGASG